MVDKQKTDNTSDLPLVSVLALCYNHSDYLALTLDSIVKQTYTNIQLIIIDDCSQDNSVEVITRFIEDNEIKCVFIKHTENKGICKSLNEAIDFIEGKYYHLIACDDILMHNTIEWHVSLLENSESNVAVVYSDAILINEKGEFYDNRFIAYHKSYLNAPSGFIFEELINGNFIPAMTVTYKSSALREIGFWDETLVYEDYDMWLRISRKYKFLFDNIPSAQYRLHSQNQHKKIKDWGLTNYYIFYKHRDIPQCSEIIKSIIYNLYYTRNPRRKEVINHFFSYNKANTILLRFIKWDISPKLFDIYKAVRAFFQ